MSFSLPRPKAALWAALVVTTPVLAHDDDPKILDSQPACQAKAFRRADLFGEVGGGDILAGSSLGFPANGVTLLSWLPLADLDGAGAGNDCWGYVSGSGREYAIIGTSSSTVFVEITDPSNATVIEIIPGPTSTWRDTKVYQDHAYSVSEGGSGIQVMDMGSIDSGTVTLVNTINDVGTSATHNVVIDETSGYLYRTGGGNEGLRIYDLSNPASPSYVSSWTTRYVHDAQVVTYTSGPLAGTQIAYCCSGFNGGFDQTGFDVLDVTDKNDIQVMSWIFYPNPGYSHQGWLSDDGQYFYLGDELDENGVLPTTTHIIDVSDPDNAFQVTSFTNNNQAIGHNLYNVGDTMYQANYRSGLRVFDYTNALSPTETAFFDTYPSDDGDAFNGLWSVYPYFPSGIVIGSDMERGLFVWWVGDPLVDLSLSAGEPSLIDPAGQVVDVQITELNLGDLAVGTEKLVYDAGGGPVEVDLVDLGNGNYQAVFPALPCGANVDWFVKAESTNGITWADPEGAPSAGYSTLVASSLNVVQSFDMQAAAGWSSGAIGDDATTGIWERGNPIGTGAQPEDDHTPVGGQCWFTGQGPQGGSIGDNDVDGGSTTLVSATLDVTGIANPLISYWRWFSNDQGGGANEDPLLIDVSDDGGSSWTSVEVVGPSGPDTSGGWIQHSFLVSDFVTPTDEIVLRFIASDLINGSIVEAAIDDLEVVDLVCGDCTPVVTNYCQTAPNSFSSGALIGSAGPASIGSNTFSLNVVDAVPNKSGLFYYGPLQIQVAFGDGFRCVGAGGAGTFRLNPVALTDGSGALTHQIDFTLPPANAGSGEITPSSTWNFQFWFRDPMGPGGNGFNLSDGLSVTFCP